MTETNQDPELLENDGEQGDASAYDNEAVANTPFDAEQFELPDDYEFEGDGDD